MRRRILLYSLLPILLIPFSANLTRAQRVDTLIEVKGHRLHIHTAGLDTRQPKAPVVVFESGLGTSLDNWDAIIDSIATFAAVFAYDRPGIGQSEPDDELPTAENVVEKLREALRSVEATPPYLLIGHSLGGAYARGFATLYPEELAGVIFNDPADFTETRLNGRLPYLDVGLSPEAADSFLTVRQTGALDPGMPRSIQEEIQVLRAMRDDDFASLRRGRLPDIPVYIITSGRYDGPDDPGEEALFRAKMQRRIERWVTLLNNVDQGELFYSANAGHFIHIDDPHLVIAAIKLAFFAARQDP